ncbi:MAG: hypothetical protein WC465_01425 [Patescibacteria group bacterium]
MKEFLAKNKWFIVIFLLTLAIFLILFYNLHNQTKIINNEREYLETVSPWLGSVTETYQARDIANIHDKLLYLKSHDKSVGDAHMNLFLAFDVWQEYLKTKNPDLKNQISDFLQRADEKMPALDSEIKRLENILAEDV